MHLCSIAEAPASSEEILRLDKGLVCSFGRQPRTCWRAYRAKRGRYVLSPQKFRYARPVSVAVCQFFASGAQDARCFSGAPGRRWGGGDQAAQRALPWRATPFRADRSPLEKPGTASRTFRPWTDGKR